MTPDEQRAENTVEENRAIEAGLEQAEAGADDGPPDPEGQPPVDVLTE